MKTSKLNQEELLQLKNELPLGAIKDIANSVGLTREYVSMVLNGKRPYNKQIVKAALDYINNESVENMEIRERFEKITKKTA